MDDKTLSKLLEIQENTKKTTQEVSEEIKVIEAIMMKLKDILQINNCTTQVMNIHNGPVKQLFQQIFECMKEVFANSDEFEQQIEILEQLYEEKEKKFNEFSIQQSNELNQLEDSTRDEIEKIKQKSQELHDQIDEIKNVIKKTKDEYNSVVEINKEKDAMNNQIKQDIIELQKTDFIEEQEKLNALKKNIQNNQQIIENYANERDNLIELINKHEIEITEYQKIIEEQNQKENELKAKITELQAKIEESIQESNDLNKLFQDKQQRMVETKSSNDEKIDEIVTLIDDKKNNLQNVKIEITKQNEVMQAKKVKLETINNEVETLKSQISSYKDEENQILEQISKLKESEIIGNSIEIMVETISNQETELLTKEEVYKNLKNPQDDLEMKIKTIDEEFDKKIKELQNEIDEIHSKNENNEENLNEYKLRIETVNINKNRLLLKKSHYLHHLKMLEHKIAKYEKVKNHHLKNVTKDRTFAKPIDRALMESFVKDDDDSSSASGGERMTYAEFLADRK